MTCLHISQAILFEAFHNCKGKGKLMQKKKAKVIPIKKDKELTEKQMEKVLEAMFGKSLIDKLKE
tara:strand:+ start:613 stop:807 length:195 start_codon:yes stop_codon:yes gene_type:complete